MATSAHRLVWRTDRQVYELDTAGKRLVLSLASDEERWLTWLETISSFSFQGQQGNLTVRKEARSRGDQYWYAYRRVGAKIAKKYLGRSADLTLGRLEEIAAAFPPATRHATDPSRSLGVGEKRKAVEADASSVLVAPSGTPLDPLSATRLHRPRTRSHFVSRSHLTFRLQQGMERALTLVSAPAGFGKMTLLAQWLAERETPIAWLSLEPEDNEPIRFFSYILAARHGQALTKDTGMGEDCYD